MKGEVGITVSKSILGNNGLVKGIFSADITLKIFSEFLASSKPTANGNIYIIDQDDKIVASSNKYEIISSGNSTGLSKIDSSYFDELKVAFMEFKSKESKGDFTIFEINNKEYLSLKIDFPKKFTLPLTNCYLSVLSYE